MSAGDLIHGADRRPQHRFLVLAVREAYLTPFPSAEGRWQINSEGESQPQWASDSRKLHYFAGNGPGRRSLMEVAIDSSQDPPVGRSTKLIDLDPSWSQTMVQMPYDVAADGRRFLMSREVPGTAAPQPRMVLVQDWESELSGREGR